MTEATLGNFTCASGASGSDGRALDIDVWGVQGSGQCPVPRETFLPDRSRRVFPNSGIPLSSLSENTGPSWHTRYGPITQAAHIPIPHLKTRSRLTWMWHRFCIARSYTSFIIGSGPHV